MQRDLEARRRVLKMAYQRYLAADRALDTARSYAVSWFPDAPARSNLLIGDPGSRIRRIHERRDRALARLTLARQALKELQSRVHQPRRRTVCLIGIRQNGYRGKPLTQQTLPYPWVRIGMDF